MIKNILYTLLNLFIFFNVYAQETVIEENIQNYVNLEEVKKLEFKEIKKLNLPDTIFKEETLKRYEPVRKVAVFVVRKDLLDSLKENSPDKYNKLIKIVEKLKLNENYYEFYVISENTILVFCKYKKDAINSIYPFVDERILWN